jgi:hypothetical protein
VLQAGQRSRRLRRIRLGEEKVTQLFLTGNGKETGRSSFLSTLAAAATVRLAEARQPPADRSRTRRSPPFRPPRQPLRHPAMADAHCEAAGFRMAPAGTGPAAALKKWPRESQ